jgi:fructose-bisphosphate aldolase class II
MPLVSMRQLLDHAAEHRYGIPAFNVNNLEQVKAVMTAAEDTDSPVIMQGSAGARRYAGEAFLRHLILAAIESHPRVPVVMHQDHGASPAACVQAIRSGFSSVMIDGSLLEDAKTPSSYDYNVQVTRGVVEIAHAVGVSVEGELGVPGPIEPLGGTGEGGHAVGGAVTREQPLTDPGQAVDFVGRTHVDALAIAVGNSHGAFTFSRRPDGETLAISRIKEIHARIPNTHLVLHGSNSVPLEWLAVIREFGGEMPEAWGVPVEQIQEAIRHGVRKLNIDTDLRLAMTGAMRRAMAGRKSEFDPCKFLKEAQLAVKALCRDRYEAFGCAGMGPRIRAVPLEDMAARYAERAFAPVVR